MTPLTNRVTRRSSCLINGREVVVVLRPDQCVELRLLGKREKFKVTITDLWRFAQRMDAPCIPARKL